MKNNIFEGLREYCQNEYVTRKDLKKITGGLICGKTIALLDQKGKGIQNRQILGKQVIYKIDDLINWLKNNTTLVNFED